MWLLLGLIGLMGLSQWQYSTLRTAPGKNSFAPARSMRPMRPPAVSSVSSVSSAYGYRAGQKFFRASTGERVCTHHGNWQQQTTQLVVKQITNANYESNHDGNILAVITLQVLHWKGMCSLLISFSPKTGRNCGNDETLQNDETVTAKP